MNSDRTTKLSQCQQLCGSKLSAEISGCERAFSSHLSLTANGMFVLSYSQFACVRASFFVFRFGCSEFGCVVKCLERLISKMTYCVSSGTLYTVHSVTQYS